MKKLLILFAFMLLITSCGKKTPSSSSPEGTSSEQSQASASSDNTSNPKERKNKEYILARVNAIYQNVFTESYGEDSDLNNQDVPSPEEKYCSKDWNDLLDKVSDYDNTNSPDKMGFFDADYWIMGQDSGNLSISDVEVTKMDENDATVELTLHNLGSNTRVRLDMVFERGNWYIDNFIDIDNSFNWKKEMEDYIK